MPRVEKFGERKVGLAALPGARKQAHETFESQGGQVGLAQAGVGRTVGAIGGQVLADITRVERERADQVANLTTLRQLNELDQQVLHSEDKGVLNKRGLDAMAARDEALASYDQQLGMIASNLKTDAQRLFFEQQKVQRRASLERQIGDHGLREMRAHEEREFKGFLESSQQRAVVNALDPSIVSSVLTEQDLRVREYAERNRIGPEATEALLQGARSNVHVGVIRQMLAQDQDRSASIYLEEVKKQIDPDLLPELQERVDRASTEGAGLRASEEIWTKHAPVGDNDPINLDRMEADARTRFADDPAALKSTIQFLRERKAGIDASRADRKEAVAGALWGAVAQGRALADVRRMPEYQLAPGQLQAQISEHIVREAEHRADRAYSLSQRGKESASRAENDKERAGWAAYWEYSEPSRLASMTENQILALTPTLGVDHVNRLMAAKRSDPKAATVDAEAFKARAHAAGLPAYKPSPSEEEKALMGELQNAVESAIAAEEVGGRRLSRTQKDELTQRIIDQKVLLNQWGRDPEAIAAIVRPEDRASAYVPIARIPQRSLGEWVNVLRSLEPRAQGLSREQILATYGDRIERAHAAAMMRLGAEEEQRRLLGN